MAKERIDKIIADQGKYSRSQVRELCRRGQVTLNGAIVKDAGTKADREQDELTVAGERVDSRARIYLMMNKPAGVVSASRDPREKTVVDLVPEPLRRRGLFPAGRLDKDTVGFVLLTNDGDFAHRMLSPKHHVPKTYEALVTGNPDEKTVEAFAAGMTLEDGSVCRPAELTLVRPGEPALVRVVLHEGMYHQIKRMFLCQGCEVVGLKRIQMGGLPLDENLAPGECREILTKEKEKIL